MKKYFKFLFCFTLIVSALISTVGFSAEIEKDSETVNGQFLLVYKPSAKHSILDGSVVSDTQSANYHSEEIISSAVSSILPDFEEYADITDTNSTLLDIPENARKIEERDGETLYQIEPDYSSFETTGYPISLLSDIDEAYVGEQRTFTTNNYYTDVYEYDVPFTCYYTSDSCEVFVQDSLTYNVVLSESDTELSAEEQQEKTDAEIVKIKTNMATIVGNKFGSTIKPYLIEHLADYTGYYGDKNGKIIILLEDIKDDYGVGGNTGYTAGYFLQNTKILHIDTYPLMKPTIEATVNTAPTDESITYAFPTVAHEFTHMIETSITNNASFDCTWFAELFAISTEASLFPEETAINEYNSFVYGSYYIKRGAVVNFKDYSVNGNVTGANYGLLYMFQNYIRGLTEDENGETKVFYNILEQTKSASTFEDATVDGINATLKALKKDYTFADFDDLVSSFYIAFMLQEQNNDKYYFYSENEDIRNLTIPISANGRIYNKSGAAIVVPLRQESFNVPSDGFEYIAFSYSETPEIKSVKYPDSVYRFLKAASGGYVPTEPYFAINGLMNYTYDSENGLYQNESCYSLLDGVCFVSTFDYLLPLRDGSFYLLGYIDNYNFALCCYSLNNPYIYDQVVIVFDAKSTIAISSFIFSPRISNNEMNHNICLLTTQSYNTISLYSAIYDRENNMLLGANSKTIANINTGVNNSPVNYQGGSMPPVTFTDTKSGKYLLKIFAFDGNNTISPLSSPYEFGFNKQAVEQ